MGIQIEIKYIAVASSGHYFFRMPSRLAVNNYNQWRIQDFPEGGALIPKLGLFCKLFAENCMKMKEFGPKGGASLAPPLDPPMKTYYTITVRCANSTLQESGGHQYTVGGFAKGLRHHGGSRGRESGSCSRESGGYQFTRYDLRYKR